MSEAQGDIAYIFDLTLNYLKGKGQIPSGALLSSILIVNEYVRQRYGIDIKLDKFLEHWIRLSEIEPSRWETVAQKNVDILTKIGMQINLVSEQGKTVKYLPFVKRKAKE